MQYLPSPREACYSCSIFRNYGWANPLDLHGFDTSCVARANDSRAPASLGSGHGRDPPERSRNHEAVKRLITTPRARRLRGGRRADVRAGEADSVGGQRRAHYADIPYLSHGIGVDEQSFGGTPVQNRPSEIPYLSHGVGIDEQSFGEASRRTERAVDDRPSRGRRPRRPRSSSPRTGPALPWTTVRSRGRLLRRPRSSSPRATAGASTSATRASPPSPSCWGCWQAQRPRRCGAGRAGSRRPSQFTKTPGAGREGGQGGPPSHMLGQA